MLASWNAREAALIATDPTRVPGLANPPFAPTTHAGQAKGDVKAKIAAEGARTVPPREHGGNCDIKDLSRGSKIYFPVYVPGGGLSMGDLHFSQGDGEITFCGAIEMAGWLDINVDVIKDGVDKYGIKNPVFKPSPIKPNYKDYLIFEGISVDEAGKQHYLDAHVAYRMACLNAIEYLKKFGYSGEQAYSILGTAPCQGHISGIVDVPNACGTLCCRRRFSTSTSCRRRQAQSSTSRAISRCRSHKTSNPCAKDAGRCLFAAPHPSCGLLTFAQETTMPVLNIFATHAAPSPTCGRWPNATTRSSARIARRRRRA